MPAPDRLERLVSQDLVTGIDFVDVHDDQVTLDVYFLSWPAVDLTVDQVRIHGASVGDGLADVPVVDVSGDDVEGHVVLRVTCAHPGDFALYRLYLDDERIDPYYNDVVFSFKAGCPSDLDCQPVAHGCPPEAAVDFPVDYRARDFWSYRRALLDFASQRYPEWRDRLEADVGIMFVEALSALGDELAYHQDRVAREAYLETATQRRSLRRHARLVDYHVHDGLGASTWLDVTVKAGMEGEIPAGTDLWAPSDGGQRVPLEVGHGLSESLTVPPVPYAVSSARNFLLPHLWDEDDTCLPRLSTELWVEGHHATDLPFDDPPDGPTGKWVLLRTDPTDAGQPARRWLVRLVTAEDAQDVVTGARITHLVWEDEYATPFELDLTALSVRCNIVPCTAGVTLQRRFAIGVDPATLPIPEAERLTVTRAVERTGPNGTIAYLCTLPDVQDLGLVWCGDNPTTARPEIHLAEVEYVPVPGAWADLERPWDWRRALLGTASSQSTDHHFELDDGRWERVVGYQRGGTEIVHTDYASGAGFTVRFGDGEFGLIPQQGTILQATYRLGNGRRGNVPADAITGFDDGLTFIEAVTNPLPVTSGQDPETPAEVRMLAPDAFRAITYRAVRPEDYAEATERLAWVQRAGAATRWTGSWLTVFTTPDPKDAVTLTAPQRTELHEQLDRFRQAAREAWLAEPRYADLDLEITICVAPDAFAGDVKEAVLQALLGDPQATTATAFFAADNFTFGAPLSRATLEATIQGVPGVRAVIGMAIRRRGWFAWRPFSEISFQVAPDEVIRVENDPLHPGRGSVKLFMEGGA